MCLDKLTKLDKMRKTIAAITTVTKRQKKLN